MSYLLTIKAVGCVECGRCSHLLPGWPERYEKTGMTISDHDAEINGATIDRVVSSCPLDLIELTEVR